MSAGSGVGDCVASDSACLGSEFEWLGINEAAGLPVLEVTGTSVLWFSISGTILGVSGV